LIKFYDSLEGCVRSLRAKGKLTESLWKLAELQIQPKDEKMRKREKR
jgi:hypothetical protein